jgi:hypothetical protein
MLKGGTNMVNDVGSYIGSPIFWWCAERPFQNENSHLMQILPHLFKTLDALYFSVQEIPKMEILKGGTVSGGGTTGAWSKTYEISIPLVPRDYMIFRSCLSLAGDVYHLINSLIKDKSLNLFELEDPLTNLMNSADKYRAVRNCLTHIDERFTEEKHKHNTVSKDENGKHDFFCFVLRNEIIHFTEYRKHHEVPFNQKAFQSLFENAKIVYKVITSHEKHKKDYAPHDQIYEFD